MHYNIHINKGITNHLRLYLGWDLFETNRVIHNWRVEAQEQITITK